MHLHIAYMSSWIVYGKSDAQNKKKNIIKYKTAIMMVMASGAQIENSSLMIPPFVEIHGI